MKPVQVEEVEDDLAAEEENKIINEEYKTWKKNTPYLYDLVITHALDWPSLTCQWFPDRETPAGKDYSVHRLLLGTHTSGQAPDYLQIAQVHIPHRKGPNAPPLDAERYDDQKGELGGHTLPPGPRVHVVQRICHKGEVNRARYMPQNPDLLATKAVSGEVLIFDRTKHGSDPDRDGVCKPDIRLVGQTKEGYGLAWSQVKAGHILSAGDDLTVCHWDTNSYTKGKPSIEPTTAFSGHASSINAVEWSPLKENEFASVSDDKTLLLWDTRSPGEPATKINAHEREVMTLAYSPSYENFILTGSADKTIALHDVRNPTKRLHTFHSHTDEVLHVSWSPHNPTIFASASSDRRINLWDLNCIGHEQTPDDQEDGPPELMFIHGGHTARPTDFCWAPGAPEHWTLTSVSEDNILQIWQPTMRIWAAADVHPDPSELEDGDAMEVEPSTSSKRGKTRGDDEPVHDLT